MPAPSLSTHLRLSATDPSRPPPLAATLLAQATLHAPLTAPPSLPRPTHLYVCRVPTARITYHTLHAYPSAACVSSLAVDASFVSCYDPVSLRVAVADRSFRGLPRAVRVLRFPTRAASDAELYRVAVDLPAVERVALAADTLAVQARARVDIFRGVARVASLHLPDRYDVAQLHVSRDAPLTASRARIDVWDVRAPAASCTIPARRARCLHMSGSRRVYALTPADGVAAVAAWDVRMPRAPYVVFRGDENADYAAFDVEESAACGLLIAGGEHGADVWDCARGGEPLASLAVGVALRDVRFTGWDADGIATGLDPGAWLSTKEGVMVLEVGHSAGVT